MERVVRNNTRKSSLFKIQAQKSKFQDHLEDFTYCKLFQTHPQCSKFQQYLKQLTSTFILHCFQAGQQSPFLQGMNYGGRNLGFSNTLTSINYKQWLPNISKASIMGQFNQWNPNSHQLEEKENGFFSVQILEKIAQGSKIQLIVEDLQGKIYKICPPSCRIIEYDNLLNDYVGLYTKYEKEKIQQSSAGVNCMIGYEIDINKINLKQCLSNISNISNSKFNTVIIKGLFDIRDINQPKFSLANKFSMKIPFAQIQLLKQFINELKQQNIKILFQVDYDQLSNKANNLFQSGYVSQKKQNQFNLQNQQVFTFLLSFLSHYMVHFKIDGFKFANLQKIILNNKCSQQCSQHNYHSENFIQHTTKQSIIFPKMINMILNRINPTSFTYCTTKCFIPGLTIPLVQGGFGFNFNSRIITNNANLPIVNPNYGRQQIYFNSVLIKDNIIKDLKITFSLMFCVKGAVYQNDNILIGKTEQQLRLREYLNNINQFRCQTVYFIQNAKILTKQLICDDNIKCFSRNNCIFLFNFGQKTTIELKLSQYQIIFCSKNNQIENIKVQKLLDNLIITLPSQSTLIISKNKY